MISRNLVYDIPMGTPDAFNVIVEIPKDTNAKYEYDVELELFRLKKVLFPTMVYPGNYGFLPQTIAEDSDPLDVLVVQTGEINMGTMVECYPAGALDLLDNGVRDVKIIAIPTYYHASDFFKSIDDMDEYFLNQIHHFFSHYKDLDAKRVEVLGWLSPDQTKAVIKSANKAFKAEVNKLYALAQEQHEAQLGVETGWGSPGNMKYATPKDDPNHTSNFPFPEDKTEKEPPKKNILPQPPKKLFNPPIQFGPEGIRWGLN